MSGRRRIGQSDDGDGPPQPATAPGPAGLYPGLHFGAQLHRPVSPFGPHSNALAGTLASMTSQHHLARYPEVGLFNQLGSLFPKSSTATAAPSPASGRAQHEGRAGDPSAASSSPRSKQSASTYAVRHQAAEQRRRARINDKLDHLRTIVPHPERTNTAGFLEETINHIEGLKKRVKELEDRLAEYEKEGEGEGDKSRKRASSNEPQDSEKEPEPEAKKQDTKSD